MGATPYQPVSFNGEMITKQKLNAMANNDQWLFENSPRIRYSAAGLTRDAGLKIIVGKTPFPVSTNDWVNVDIYFGSFFSAGSHPVITATAEITGFAWRKYISIGGLSGGEIDNTGFRAQVVARENIPWTIERGGWIHWQAVGY